MSKLCLLLLVLCTITFAKRLPQVSERSVREYIKSSSTEDVFEEHGTFILNIDLHIFDFSALPNSIRLHFLKEATFSFHASSAEAYILSKLPGVISVSTLLPEAKVAPQLRDALANQTEAEATDITRLLPICPDDLGPFTKLKFLFGTEQGKSQAFLDLISTHIDAVAFGGGGLQLQPPCSSKFRGSDNQASFFVPIPKLNDTVRFLMSKMEISWIEIAPHHSLQNGYLRPMIQTRNSTLSNFTSPTSTSTPLCTPAVNLTGLGEILGVGDTGLDTNSCFFYDPLNPNSFGPAHRKIAAYIVRPGADATDSAGGHGTHVCGTAVGSARCSSASDQQYAEEYNGMAYDAKVAFMDLELTGTDDLILPDDLMDYFGPFRDAGARVVSSSWGGGASWYDLDMRATDEFAYLYQDFLPVFAAGNAGRGSMYSIASPSSAKNALAVGASMSNHQSFLDNCCWAGSCCSSLNTLTSDPQGVYSGPGNLASFSSRGPTLDGRIKPEVVAPGQYVISAYASPGATPGHCSQNAGSVNAAVVPMQGTSMSTPAVSGLAILVRQYFTSGFYPTGSRNVSNGFTPSGSLLKAVLVNSGQDLPGLVNIDGQGTWVNVQSYWASTFLDGFGETVATKSLSLSGITAHSLFVVDTLPYTNPNFTRANATFGSSSNATNANAGNAPNATGISEGRVSRFCFRVNGTAGAQWPQPFKATLAWTDPPPSMQAPYPTVNDLDLVVTGPNNSTWLGNGVRDILNTVEQVSIQSPAALAQKAGSGSLSSDVVLTVSVYGRRVPLGPQHYSLVVTGLFDQIKCPASAMTCPSNCNGASHGACSTANGTCECSPNFTGPDCSIPIVALSPGQVQPATAIPLLGFTYYRILVPSNASQAVVTMTRLGPTPSANAAYWTYPDPDLYVKIGSLPTLWSFDAVDNTINSVSSITVDVQAALQTQITTMDRAMVESQGQEAQDRESRFAQKAREYAVRKKGWRSDVVDRALQVPEETEAGVFDRFAASQKAIGGGGGGGAPSLTVYAGVFGSNIVSGQFQITTTFVVSCSSAAQQGSSCLCGSVVGVCSASECVCPTPTPTAAPTVSGAPATVPALWITLFGIALLFIILCIF